MNRPMIFAGLASVVVVVLLGALSGCKTDTWRFLDPSTVVNAPTTNFTTQIYSQASPADEATELPPGATFPSEDDLKTVTKDYVVGPLDVVDVSILDLFSEGLETVLRRQVTESGHIDLPLLPAPIKAEGLTQEQLRQTIIQAYSPDILKNATVSVSVVLPRANTFSILGAVARPGTYNMAKRDMRLLDAVAAAGGQSQTNIRYVLILRPGPAGPAAATTQPAGEGEMILPPLPEIPGAEAPPPKLPASAPASKPAVPEVKALPAGGPHLAEMALGPVSASKPAPSDVGALDSTKSTKWVQSSGGKSTPVHQTAAVASKPSGEGAAPVKPAGLPATEAASKPAEDIFGWTKTAGSEGRVIAVDLQKLNSGDPRMNLVIRDDDIINVPLLEQGEFYVMGEVLRPGVYSLTGRQVTVKMAVAAAGNLSPLSWPENSILIRRISDHEEQFIPINIEAIFLGKAGDLYLKPNDVIAVGSSWCSPFLAVIRNAFRLTYGFGFIYDRNFAEGVQQYGPLTSKRFTRW